MRAGATKEGVKESSRPRDLFFYLFLHRLWKKVCISKIERGLRGWGGDVPKNGPQNKTEGKQRRAKMEAGGDGGACLTLIL